MVQIGIVAVVAFGLADAPLSMLGRHELTCPVCGQRFTSVACAQSNTEGGVDRDLFARAVGPQPVYYLVSTCARCGFSGYPSDFDPAVSIPPDVRRKILEERQLKLPEGFTPDSDPRTLDASERYARAIACYRWRQKPDEALAWLHLRASWVTRDEGSVVPPDDRLARVLAYVRRWRPTMPPGGNQADADMQLVTRVAEARAAGHFNRYQCPHVDLAMALILRLHGENGEALRILDGLRGLDRFSPPLREALERMRDSIAKEREHQASAARYFERAVWGQQIAADNEGAARYLLGELCRRLDRDAEAVAWFDRALASPTLAPDVQQWARQQRASCAAAGHANRTALDSNQQPSVP